MAPPATEPSIIPRESPLAESTEPKPARISGGILPADLPPGEYLLVLETTGDPASYRSLELWASTGSRVGSIVQGNISSAAISRDGALLAVRNYYPDDPLGSSDEYLVFNTTEALPPPRWGEVQGGATGIQMEWRPDGEGLGIPHKWDIYFLPLGSVSPIRLTDCRALLDGSDCDDPSWSPDGQALVFSLLVPGAGSHLAGQGAYILSLACAESPSACMESAIGPLPQVAGHTTWSPDGTMIAGTTADEDKLALVTYPDLALLRVVPIKGLGPLGVRFSPDSRNIAFDSECTVNVLSIDTWEATTFASNSDECRDPLVVGWIEVK